MILFVVLPLFIISLACLLGYKYTPNIVKKENTKTVEKFDPKCTRSEPLKNLPQYDRALSLIKQRIQESIQRDNNTDFETSFLRFPYELVNCIYVKEEKMDPESKIEGYFTIDSKEIKNNYFPITVNKEYKEADDIVTAILIAHEMTHVQQFLEEIPTKKRNDCLRSEADAFVSQYDFFGVLSMEEMVSVNTRIKLKESSQPQILMISKLQELSRDFASPACGFMSRACDREVLKVQMYKLLTKDEFYRKQCEN